MSEAETDAYRNELAARLIRRIQKGKVPTDMLRGFLDDAESSSSEEPTPKPPPKASIPPQPASHSGPNPGDETFGNESELQQQSTSRKRTRDAPESSSRRIVVLGERLKLSRDAVPLPNLYRAVKDAAPKADPTNTLVEVYELPPGCTWMIGDAEEPLLVRKATKDIYGDIKSQFQEKGARPYAVVIGNPGIGKSWFLCYALRQVLIEGTKSVYMKRGPESWFFDHRTQEAYYAWDGRMPNLQPFARELIYLHDVLDGDKPPLVRVPTIIAASPLKGNWHEYDKQLKARRHYMLPWELNELKAARPYLFANPQLSESDVSARFHEVGGIPRIIGLTERGYSRYLVDLNEAIDAIPEPQMIHLNAHLNPLSDGAPAFSSKLVFVTDGPVSFLSQRILNEVLERGAKLPNLSYAGLGRAVKILSNNIPATSSWFFYEQYFHIGMASGRFDIWGGAEPVAKPARKTAQMQPSATSSAQKCSFPNPPGNVQYIPFESRCSAQQGPITLAAGCYYRPTAFKFPLLDAFFCVSPGPPAQIVAFQVTLADRKGPLTAGQIKGAKDSILDVFRVDITNTAQCEFQMVLIVDKKGSDVFLNGDKIKNDSEGQWWNDHVSQFRFFLPADSV